MYGKIERYQKRRKEKAPENSEREETGQAGKEELIISCSRYYLPLSEAQPIAAFFLIITAQPVMSQVEGSGIQNLSDRKFAVNRWLVLVYSLIQ